MGDFKIISDSTCDLSPAQAAALDVDIVPLYTTVNGRDYLKERVELTMEAFYKAMREEHVMPRTSQPSVEDYMNAFTPYLDDGRDILCFCLTATFSGSYQSAVGAANILKERYPERQIFIVDSMTVSYGIMCMINEARRLAGEGVPISGIYDLLNRDKVFTRAYFTVDSLEYLRRGGRIGGLASLVGTLFDIKPVGIMKDGVLTATGKARTQKRAIEQLVKLSAEYTEGRPEDYFICAIHTDRPGDAETVLGLLARELGGCALPPALQLGTTVGTHAGPDLVGVMMFRKISA